MCTIEAFQVTRRLFSLLLATLRLQAYRCSCNVDLGRPVSPCRKAEPIWRFLERQRPVSG